MYLVVIIACGALSSCMDDTEVFPRDELPTGGNGEETDPIEHGPPSLSN